MRASLSSHRRRATIAAIGAGWCVRALALSPTKPAAGLTIGEAINQAGRQRMLSQRIAKAYAQIVNGTLVNLSNRVLHESVELFERQLATLQAFAPRTDIANTYAELAHAWDGYRALIGQRPVRDKLADVARISDEVLAHAHRGTMQLEAYAGTPIGKLVNIAGRERMLSQRLAKLYALRVGGIDSVDLTHASDQARNEFTGALNLLEHADEDTQPIREGLTLVEQQWIFFDLALHSQTEAAGDQAERERNATNVATTSERILAVMDDVTNQYARLH